MTNLPGFYLAERAHRLVENERQGGIVANLREVAWLRQSAARLAAELMERPQARESEAEAALVWRRAGAELRRLLHHGGEADEWEAAYRLFKAADLTNQPDRSLWAGWERRKSARSQNGIASEAQQLPLDQMSV
jgi:hypothetical protein